MGSTDSDDRASASTFTVKDCALVTLATGRKVRLLQELRNRLEEIDTASLYHHLWGGLLASRFEEREYHNDFAAWVRHGIHDAVLAERLAVLDPTGFADLEALRQEVLEHIDNRLDEAEHLSWSRATLQFEFVCSQIVVFHTHRELERPEELAEVMPELSPSSVFYHFIDARRRTPDRRDDFSDWLSGYGEAYSELQSQLAGVDPYFGSLSELRDELSELFSDYFSGTGQ